ncbi:Hpt domain-containing protein [Cephalotus follicularis]|uniref:Histidine-containing phosphotransfer protein n=1 Tax=Cephalotus follicularis TaxID=3775 RepID=A0A1Q3B5F3_CEPFO|nr:Hpt domain-containing protein [Cephalotus follicularis]
MRPVSEKGAKEKATMDAVAQLQRQLVDYTASLFHEGYLDDQFNQLRQLQDESNPDFVVEVVTLYFEDSERLLNELTKALQQQSIDFKKVDAQVHQFKGSSSSIGAQRVQKVCIAFRNCCEEQNIEGCNIFLQQVKHEYTLVKSKLETLFKLDQQILAARVDPGSHVIRFLQA